MAMKQFIIASMTKESLFHILDNIVTAGKAERTDLVLEFMESMVKWAMVDGVKPENRISITAITNSEKLDLISGILANARACIELSKQADRRSRVAIIKAKIDRNFKEVK